eukprot:13779747-Heterocapsa_arctica.AAC.1
MHTPKDDKAEWCEEKGFEINRIKGDGNCLYTCLGESRTLNGNQVRQSLHNRAEELWAHAMTFYIDGGGLISSQKQALDRNGRGVMEMTQISDGDEGTQENSAF